MIHHQTRWIGVANGVLTSQVQVGVCLQCDRLTTVRRSWLSFHSTRTFWRQILTECTDSRNGGKGDAPLLSRMLHRAGFWNVTWVPWTDPIFGKCPFPNACTDNSSLLLRPLHAGVRSSSNRTRGSKRQFEFHGSNHTVSNATSYYLDAVQMTNCVPTTGGPLCAVCDAGHYRANRTMPGCIPCAVDTILVRVGILSLVVSCILTLVYACR
jgi:hypothetical protein